MGKNNKPDRMTCVLMPAWFYDWAIDYLGEMGLEPNDDSLAALFQEAVDERFQQPLPADDGCDPGGGPRHPDDDPIDDHF